MAYQRAYWKEKKREHTSRMRSQRREEYENRIGKEKISSMKRSAQSM